MNSKNSENAHRGAPLLVRSFLPALLGIVAGVGSSLLLARPAVLAASKDAPAPQAELPTKRTEGPAPTAPQAPLGLATARLSALEERIDSLAPTNAPPDPAEREDSRRRFEAVVASMIDRHEQAPVDPAWSKTTNAALRPALDTLVQENANGTALEGLDCRTNSCVATLSFSSYAAAQQGIDRYVTTFYGVNCVRTAKLGEAPEDPTAPVQAQLVFQDCKRD
ncbi:hypothetical protein [Polyangium mundeleinium]|uniref:Uncharacterized protein n=1 Tax=Polyangium mundeleinium TaxID=2995306 RepID=A0ABT5EY50_9BACT|nr:hypothetical protein [Polyangium mundeleinium]MDC0746745.1 hypothetical protein [Polyangium mundeleinium]